MDINKNSYIFSFAAIMVIIVAALLSGASILLKDPQQRNVELEKKQNILKSVGIYVSRDSSEIEYDTYIKEQLILNHLGEIQEGSAFDIDLAKEIKKDSTQQQLPLYIAHIKGKIKYIIPLRGKGLWGPIWGFISFNDDLNTVFAAVFDHKKETPGLGAEINNKNIFQDQFTDKTIMEGDEFVSIIVQKGGSDGNIHKVDAISGGTITSDGVTDMLYERLNMYRNYFKYELEENDKLNDQGKKQNKIDKEEKEVKEVHLFMDINEKNQDTMSNMNDQNKTINDNE